MIYNQKQLVVEPNVEDIRNNINKYIKDLENFLDSLEQKNDSIGEEKKSDNIIDKDSYIDYTKHFKEVVDDISKKTRNETKGLIKK